MNRDRLTSRGWAWHQGLARYLAIEAEMFKCDDCRSCGEHSGALESARQYALRIIQQPMPHMDRVLGDKLTVMTNRELGNELDRWADSRDRYPKLDSIALRVAASRFRALEEGCDHPLGSIYHDQTPNADFCQNCGAIVDEDGETVNKWTCEETSCEEPSVYHATFKGTPVPKFSGDERPWAKEEAVWHAANQSALPPDLHTERQTAQEAKTWSDRIREDAGREGRERASVRGGSRADGPITPYSTGRLSVPRTSCGVTTGHDSHGVMQSYCSGLLIDDSTGRLSVPRTSCGVTTPHDSHGRAESYCSGVLIDDSKGGDTRGLTPELLADLGEGLGALATQLEGVADGLDGLQEHGDAIDEKLRRCFENLPDGDEWAADDGTCDFDLCDCHDDPCNDTIQGYDDEDSGGAWLPKARCALVSPHEEHDWPIFFLTGVKRHCDGAGLNRPWMGGS